MSGIEEACEKYFSTSKLANKLLEDRRVDVIAPADYSEGSRMDKFVKALLNQLKAEYELKKERVRVSVYIF